MSEVLRERLEVPDEVIVDHVGHQDICLHVPVPIPALPALRVLDEPNEISQGHHADANAVSSRIPARLSDLFLYPVVLLLPRVSDLRLVRREESEVRIADKTEPEPLGRSEYLDNLVRVKTRQALALGMDIPNWPPENIEDLAKRLEEPF